MTAEELKQIFGRAVPDKGKLQEIRLRAGKPVLVFLDGREYLVGREELLEAEGAAPEAMSPVLADPALIREILGIFPGIPCMPLRMRSARAFLPLREATGWGSPEKAVTEGSRLRTIGDISSPDIRLAHESPAAGIRCSPGSMKTAGFRMLILIVPPGAGKTTTAERRGAPGIQWKPVRAGAPDSGGG